MPYSKQKVKGTCKTEKKKYYSKYVLKFNIRTSFYVLKFDIRTLFYVLKFNIRTLLNELEVCILNLSTVKLSTYIEFEYVFRVIRKKKQYVKQKYLYRSVRKSRVDCIFNLIKEKNSGYLYLPTNARNSNDTKSYFMKYARESQKKVRKLFPSKISSYSVDQRPSNFPSSRPEQ
jgi:hypothetical protein